MNDKEEWLRGRKSNKRIKRTRSQQVCYHCRYASPLMLGVRRPRVKSDMETENETSVWHGLPPASEVAIQRLLTESSLELPEAYLAQLRISNGGEGSLGIEPGWVCLWPAEEVIEANIGYEVAEYVPNFFAFSSSGGGEMFAFKMDVAGEWPIHMIPFIVMDEKDAIEIAESFAVFRKMIGGEWRADE